MSCQSGSDGRGVRTSVPEGSVGHVVHYSVLLSLKCGLTGLFFFTRIPTIILDTVGLTKRHLCNQDDGLCVYGATKKKIQIKKSITPTLGNISIRKGVGV